MTGFRKHLDFILIDLVCLEVAFFLASGFRNGFNFNIFENDLYRTIAIVLAISSLFSVIIFNSLKNVLKRGFGRELYSVLVQSTAVLLLTNLFIFAVKQGNSFSRIVLFLTVGIYAVLSLIMRCLWKTFLLKHHKFACTKLLIVTDTQDIDNLVGNIRNSKIKNYSICAVASPSITSKKDISQIPFIAYNDQEILDFVCREWVDEVLISMSDNNNDTSSLINKLISTGVTIHISIPEIFDVPVNRCIIEKIADNTVITSSIKAVKAEHLLIKRIIDILGGLVGCLITVLIFIFLAPAIKLSSPGKVFFAQERIGLNGKKFKMYKFRSMYNDAESRKQELMKQNRIADGMMFKLDYDPRIIGCKQNPDGTIKKGLGNFIRESSLDEFPQFFNVLKGDMSLVGTRPPTVDEWEKYKPHHRIRVSIKPGITGLWQVSGRSSISDFERVVELDKKYISEWSIWLDFKILLKTIIVVIKRKGSF